MFNCAITQQVSVWLINVNLQTVKIKLNLHLPQPQHCFKSVLFFFGQQKDNLLDRDKDSVNVINKLCSVPCYCLFVPLQRQQRDKLSPEAVELAQTL